jgi:predicted metal-dependent HD superfamily phosphohydrolase
VKPADLHFDVPPALRARLQAMYTEPQRHYHALAHVEALLGWLAHWRALAREPRLIEAAIWFHDAVYDTHRDDNEPRSAELARDELRALAWAEADVARVVTMVRATQHHAAAVSDADTLLFLDLDLSVLAQRAEVYDAYSVAVRAEFAWVNAQRYRAGRMRVLQSFMTRDAIYRTPALHTAWESAARANLARELQAAAAHTGRPLASACINASRRSNSSWW